MTRTAVLLDIDGTLVDSTYHHAIAWSRAFARCGPVRPELHRLHRAIGMGGDRLVAHVAGDAVEEEHGDALRDAWREEYAELRAEVRPLPGARDLVLSLRKQGLRVALASSGDPEFSREALELLDVGDAVEVLLTSEDVDASKPDPDLLGVTLERLAETEPVERAAFVGDTVYDVESASRAGMPCVALLTGGFGHAELEDAGAVHVTTSPADLVGSDWKALSGPLTKGSAT